MNWIPYLPHWVSTPAEEQNELFLERIEIPSASACSPSSSEHESDSNERVRLSSSDGFSSSSRNSSQVNQQHQVEKGNGTKVLKVRTSGLIYSAHLHECQQPWQPIFDRKSKTINNLIYPRAGGLYLYVWRLLLMGSCRRLKYVCHTFNQVNSTNKKNGGKCPLTFPWTSVFYFDFVFNVLSFSKQEQLR